MASGAGTKVWDVLKGIETALMPLAEAELTPLEAASLDYLASRIQALNAKIAAKAAQPPAA